MRHKVRSVKPFGVFLKRHGADVTRESGSMKDAAKAWADLLHFVEVRNRREAMKAADRFARMMFRNVR
jgi:hypothetical protein